MCRITLILVVLGLIGCGDDKPKNPPQKAGVEVSAPGVNVKAGEKGVEIKAPGVEVKAGQ